MLLHQQICCPNCGSREAERHYVAELIRTQCPDCDYLLITCATTAKVVEAYVPGVNKLSMRIVNDRPVVTTNLPTDIEVLAG
jgi:hypothetical protein